MPVQSASPLGLPEGEAENSPGRSPRKRTKPWEWTVFRLAPSRRDGRNLPPHITRIVFNPMFLQEGYKFRLEIALSMMFLLARNVRQRSLNLGPSDGEGSITLLPFEVRNRTGCMHPVRGCALDLLHRCGNRQRRRQRQQNVRMIFRSADAKRLHPMLASGSAHVSPEPQLNLWNNCLFPPFGGKDAMS